MQTEMTQEGGKFYVLFIDGTEYRVHQASMTGAEIMTLGGIPLEVGLIQILSDGTEKQVAPDEVIEFKHPGRFKRAPKFKRG